MADSNNGKDELGGAMPAWKLREKMKNSAPRPSNGPPNNGPLSLGLDAPMDPSLPPAFRAAFNRHRKKKSADEFMNMDSVHSTKTHVSINMSTPTTATVGDSGSDSSSFDGEDSFASVGEDDDDDEAYRESRNQIARQSVEAAKPIRHNMNKLKTTGVHGTPLDFIAE